MWYYLGWGSGCFICMCVIGYVGWQTEKQRFEAMLKKAKLKNNSEKPQ